MSLDERFVALVKEAMREVLREERAGAQPELLTPAQAGELAGGLSAKTIRAWIRAGKLKRYGTERRPMVSRAELMELLERPSLRRAAEKGPTAEAEVHRLTRRTG